MSRAYYIDRIRVILTALVVLHHTAITYGAPGGWYYRELPFTGSLTGLFQVLFVSVNQAYFMGLFFLIAGYFTPASYDRKGPVRFSLDRLVRLGMGLASGKTASTNGGLGVGAILYAFWEPFVAWGIIATYLVWFREQATGLPPFGSTWPHAPTPSTYFTRPC